MLVSFIGWLYWLALAYEAKGDTSKAQEYWAKAAGFNSLPSINYAFIRVKAQKMAKGNKLEKQSQ